MSRGVGVGGGGRGAGGKHGEGGEGEGGGDLTSPLHLFGAKLPQSHREFATLLSNNYFIYLFNLYI